MADVRLHPGVPDRSIMLAALDHMLAHPRPRIEFTRIEQTNERVPADRAAEAIVDAWEAAGAPAAYGISAKSGARHTLVITTEDASVGLLGHLLLVWTLDPGLRDGLEDLLVDLARLLGSPLAVLSHKSANWRERTGWEAREGLHLRAREKVHGPAFYGLRLGLAGVAHRTVLGDELVAMFGEDRLAALPPELAHRRNGRWVLTPTDDPLEWTHDRWCPGEAAIIEALGPEHFFDPSTGALPTVVPDLPEVAPYRCRTREPGTGAWIEHNA